MDECQETVLERFKQRYDNRTVNEKHGQYMIQRLRNGPLKKWIKPTSEPDVYTYKADNGLTYPVSPETPWFNFTKPVIETGRKVKIARNYRKFRVGDRLLIWQSLTRGGSVDHIMAQITSDGKDYSFGFGYYGEGSLQGKLKKFAEAVLSYLPVSDNIKLGAQAVLSQAAGALHPIDVHPGSIYTPDLLLENRLFQYAEKGFTNLRLIVNSRLTQGQLTAMKNYLDTVQVQENLNPNISVEMYKNPAVPMHPETIPLIDETELLLSLDPVKYAEMKRTSKKLMEPGLRVVFSELFYVVIDTVQYCEISRKGSKTYSNCAAFLTKLFDEVLSCRGEDFVVNPRFCRQISGTHVSTCPWRPRRAASSLRSASMGSQSVGRGGSGGGSRMVQKRRRSSASSSVRMTLNPDKPGLRKYPRE